jgi:uncharacterized beta-barrel protein YwiB (DUF1934 family)
MTPIQEYENINTSPLKGKEVLVEMTSTQCDMTGVGFFTVRRDLPPERVLKEIGEENNKYSLVSEGFLDVEDSRLVLSYEETAIEGVKGCYSYISFDFSDPDCITVERRGAINSSFVISKGQRMYSVYATPFGEIDMCTYGKRVENTLSPEGGTLVLEYAVELRGLTAQRTKMEVKVKELKR